MADTVSDKLEVGDKLIPRAVTLSRGEWANLIRRLRKADAQLGRLAWMGITSIEAQLMEQEKNEC